MYATPLDTSGQHRAIVTWSTRELADLAGTTVNTVRHYHRLGLLEEPERRVNGYKQYRVRHLVRLLRLRRLVELGLPLARISGDDTSASAGLPEVDAEIKADIERLRGVRAEIAVILRSRAPVDSPRGFEGLALRISDADRALIHVLSRVYSEDAMRAIRAMVAAESARVSAEFTALAPDADDATRQNLARRIARGGAHWRSARDRNESAARKVVDEAIAELYSAAQCDVLRRASAAQRLT